ncbi:hypothetical protein EYF80_036643 [Liparis tanakae]|uniref:Uncharacterized protein n=1 Tax=Liparis tanakae TaxID=230148 RepID=A0A4Z2GK04_9TELE|nr:hypothetical protein EYF80_036643 [Liparis tanakae]
MEGKEEQESGLTWSSHHATSTVVSVSSPLYTVLKDPLPSSMSNFRKRPSGDVPTAFVSTSSISSCTRFSASLCSARIFASSFSSSVSLSFPSVGLLTCSVAFPSFAACRGSFDPPGLDVAPGGLPAVLSVTSDAVGADSFSAPSAPPGS